MIVIVVVLLLFGRNKISDLMGDVAGGIKAFKKGMAEDDTPPKADPKAIDHQAQAPSAAPAANPTDTKARADS
jgi:sec-independent protein translocase protein TatA